MADQAASADRRAEEQAKLVERLRRSLVTVVDDNNDLKEYNATLKKSQAQLLERTAELNELVARLQASTAESAAQNARLTRDLASTKSALDSATAKVTELASELNAYRETEGAIATALATASVEDVPEGAASAGASAASAGPAPDRSADGTPAWLEAEARAGGEARSRSLKVQVLALRRALFKVARRAVKRGASEEQVGSDIDEAVGSAAEHAKAAAGAEAVSAGAPAAAAGASTPLDRYRKALGVAGAGALSAGTEAAGDRSDADGKPPASEPADSAVIQPPAPIDHAPGEAAVPAGAGPSGAAAGGGAAPEGDATDAGSQVTVGLLGFLLAPPIAIADALAAASEAVFGADDEDEVKSASGEEPAARVGAAV